MNGSCFCGSVTYTLSKGPVLAAYCHCTLCQRLTGCPFVHTVHFEPDAFRWTHDAPHDTALESFALPVKPWKKRWRCKACGVCVVGHNSKTGNWSVWGGTLERDEEGKIKSWDTVKPTAHIFYATRTLDIGDELGKWEGYENKSNRIA
ncbi:hypothetical protein OBBRIDRAFT_794528 [Obba rivulosa]|uniref:CENP-V/GFA domain-containing protein n=1 Tax=Obba rivulosa TaxID=1052685 RepID=A0A8E2DN80_9APHY|nr:hypothetical protein OBBRIDRAFT_794528 [Obba rivulosa]